MSDTPSQEPEPTTMATDYILDEHATVPDPRLTPGEPIEEPRP